MRLIDADAFLERMSHTDRFFGVVYDINDSPTVDAVPVVHGKWNSMDGYKTRKVCSECGWDVPEYGKFYSYCPNCGAKMDLEEEHG